MTALLWMLTVAWAGPLLSVRPPGPGEVGVDAGEVWIPRGTTVQPRKGDCPHETVPVTILVVDEWYRIKRARLPRSGQEGLSASRRSPQARRAGRGRSRGACGRSSILPALRPHPCLGTSKHALGSRGASVREGARRGRAGQGVVFGVASERRSAVAGHHR